ncbi:MULTISPECIES: hypothetical protein [Streptomycetaceae]|uniref:hypothetical protein n=1 Tax=Streptomycetaceae TaxID=2062 RepID=UPI000CDC3338|nr:hypothetical protein [Streptomyces sp. CB01881]AUY48866.1 hypothetical protein C2142_07800 [Streptomyces sp. CB01881]TYC77355.1 hypothetical protein EH183_07810 [Streptomyces sp. CB01881]
MNTDLVYVLDSEGLSQGALGTTSMGARLKDAARSGIRVVTSSMTMIEAHHERINKAAWNWTLSRIVVEPVTQEVAEEAVVLLRDAGLHGHKYAIDAALVAVALRQSGRVVVYTSDVDDIERISGGRLRVARL